VPDIPPPLGDEQGVARDRHFRTDPDWFKYLDSSRKMAGGVAFLLRLSPTSNGVIVTPNLTSDIATGLGQWTEAEIEEVIRSGKRRDGTYLFMFPPHSYYPNLAPEDVKALAYYVKSLPPVRYAIQPRSLPFPVGPGSPGHPPAKSPSGRSLERASYLIDALVGCRECHSHSKQDGSLSAFTGGDPSDSALGVFRLGPDLPLRQKEKGLAAWPYPGFAVLYSPNLTRYGLGGDLAWVSTRALVESLRSGVAPIPDSYGRPDPIEHVMMWQFYASMSDEDAYSIAEFIKTLRYEPHDIGERLIYFGTDWEAAFGQVFRQRPSQNDLNLFGK
jgi:hypothetical protein